MRNIRYIVTSAYGFFTVGMEYDQTPREGPNGCGATGYRTIISGLTRKVAESVCGALTDAHKRGVNSVKPESYAL
jgi:hypothetical protein